MVLVEASNVWFDYKVDGAGIQLGHYLLFMVRQSIRVGMV